MSDQRFEYMAVRVNGLVPSENAYTKRVNSVAEHGWRLVSLSPGKNGNDMLIFERSLDV